MRWHASKSFLAYRMRQKIDSDLSCRKPRVGVVVAHDRDLACPQLASIAGDTPALTKRCSALSPINYSTSARLYVEVAPASTDQRKGFAEFQ
jgi:hypothetical protein